MFGILRHANVAIDIDGSRDQLLSLFIAALLDQQHAKRSDVAGGLRRVFSRRVQPIKQRTTRVRFSFRHSAQPRIDPRSREKF